MAVSIPKGSPSRVSMRIGCYIMFSISSAVLLARIYVRTFISRKMGLDDLFVMIAGICSFGIIICVTFMFDNGIGYHSYDIADQAVLDRSVLWPWISLILYFFTLGCIKTSIICLYLRLATSTIQRRVLWVAFGIILGQGIISCLTTAAFLCHPIKVVWTGGFGGPKCINILALSYYNAAFHVTTDILLAIAPIPVIKGLHMDKSKKIGLSIMFGLGILAIGGTISRQIANTIAIHKPTDFTWYWAPAELCCVVELSLGIIFASVPALQPLVGHCFTNISCFNESSYRRDGAYKLKDNHYRDGESELVTIGKMRRNNMRLRPDDSILFDTRITAGDSNEGFADEECGSVPPLETVEKRILKAKGSVTVEHEVRVDYEMRL